MTRVGVKRSDLAIAIRREKVAAYRAAGMTRKEMAELLGVSVPTIDADLAAVKKALAEVEAETRLETEVEDDLIRQRLLKVEQLILAGVSARTIARKLGVAYTTVRRDVQRLAEIYELETADSAEWQRQLDLARIDRMIMGLWKRAANGEFGAVDRVRSLIHDRAELYGYRPPQRVDVNHHHAIEVVEIVRESPRRSLTPSDIVDGEVVDVVGPVRELDVGHENGW